MKSLRRTLLVWLGAGLTLGIVAAAAYLYRDAQLQAAELLDYQLQQIAESLPSRAFSPLAPERPDILDTSKDVVIQIWDRRGIRLYYSHGQSILPQRAQLGFSYLNTPSGPWRVYGTALGDTVVQVAQPMASRNVVAARTALRTVAPLLLLLPLLGALVWVAVGRGLVPLRQVAAEVQARDAHSLSPISEQGLPSEIQPLAHALNDLLQRLHRSIDAQRAFVADAAHELRSPLTALRLQLQLLERARGDGERSEALADLNSGLQRATRLVEQLLTLARQEPGQSEPAAQSIDMAELTRQEVDEQRAQADRLGVRLSDDGVAREPVALRGDPDALRVMLRNLLDNALRYTPRGGEVTVSLSMEGAAVLTVRDTGPGVAEQELPRIFDRFYRAGGSAAVTGSGLGLAIVRRIALRHGAEVSARNWTENRTEGGFEVEVRFPSGAGLPDSAPPS